MNRFVVSVVLCAGMSRPSLSSSASDFLERKYYASEVCPGPLPDMTFLDGGVCDGMAQSTRCINSTNYELLQWPYADCSGVPAVIDTFTAPPQCADSAVETCVSDMQLTFPVRRTGFVNFYSRYGDDCAFPPAPGITYFSNILMPLDKCNRDKVLHGVAKTYSCSAAGLTVTTFEEETCSRATAPNVTVYKTGVCMPLGGPPFVNYWLITCPSEAAPAATSKAGLIGGLAAGGLAIAAVGGYFLWARRASMFPGAGERARGVYATLEARAGR